MRHLSPHTLKVKIKYACFLATFSSILSCSDSGDTVEGLFSTPPYSSSGSSSTSSSSSGSSGTVFGPDGSGITVTLAVGQQTLAAQESTTIALQFSDSGGNPVSPIGEWRISSPCLTNSQSDISSLQSLTTSVVATYTPQTCVGEDELSAEITYLGETKNLTTTLSVLPDVVNQVQFVNNTPPTIALQGSGLTSQSNVTFQIKGIAASEGAANQQIEFSLEGATGGASLVASTGVTDDQGMVTAKVQAGNIPGLVVVKALHIASGLTASSSAITVSTGLTYPQKFRIGASVYNPDAWNKINGERSEITVALSDRVGNAVANGTRIRFFAEAGRIGDSCETLGGSCTVTWDSRADEPSDGRIQIFATTKGVEHFSDLNNNYLFDDGDVFEVADDLAEPYSDYNQNDMYDIGEPLIDSNGDTAWSLSDGVWNGPNCQHSSLCSDTEFVDLGKQLTLYISNDDNPTLCSVGTFPTPNSTINLSVRESIVLSDLYLSDGNTAAGNSAGPCPLGNPLPNGTSISFTATSGNILNSNTWVVASDAQLPTGPYSVRYVAPNTPSEAILSLNIKVPGRADTHKFVWSLSIN